MVEIVVRIILIIFFVIYSFLIPFRKKQKENVIILVARRNIEDAQNVHDKNILDLTEQKYLYLKNKHNSPSLILDCYKFIHLNLPHRKKFVAKINGNNTWRGYKEIELFALVCKEVQNFQNSKISGISGNLDKAIEDCYEEGELVCITGRVARYLSVFDGWEGKLGEVAITENVLFQQALHKTRYWLNYYLEKNPEYKELYENMENEEKLAGFLAKIKNRIKKKIIDEFKIPDLKAEELIKGI